jgi:hypothetical protein
MLLMPDRFHQAVVSYQATSPDMTHEGVNGYMEVEATFVLRDLHEFGKLWADSMVYPSDRSAWYWGIKRGLEKWNEE